jgi:antitoxin (DNA-binding transcriptional repressor) of toxin-antitoxin stability system
MTATATIRDLRNRFPKIRKILEAEGEVVLTESGQSRYRLIPYVAPAKTSPTPVDYWARLTSLQPTPMTAAQAGELHEENRGDR